MKTPFAPAAESLTDLDDVTVARVLRRSYFRRNKRRNTGRGKPAPEPGRAYTPDEDQLIGTMSDARLGKLLGRSNASVRSRRIRLGKSLLQPLRQNWSPEEDALLGKFADSEVARKLNRT
jgi:hypothetical protein